MFRYLSKNLKIIQGVFYICVFVILLFLLQSYSNILSIVWMQQACWGGARTEISHLLKVTRGITRLHQGVIRNIYIRKGEQGDARTSYRYILDGCCALLI